MKTSIWIAAGVAVVATAVYLWRKNQPTSSNTIPEKENERHHLTNIFSKAKRIAIGN